MLLARIIAVHSVKGGSGKTSLALNLAGVAALTCQRETLLWDLDAQGSSTFLCSDNPVALGAKAVFERKIGPASLVKKTQWAKLDVITADLSLRQVEHVLQDIQKPKRLKKIIKQLSPSYDVVILDCPPGLSEVNDQVFEAADILLVPVTPNPLGFRAFEQIQGYLAERGGRPLEIFPVISMADKRKLLHRSFLETHHDWPVLPMSSRIENVAVRRAPVEAFAARSREAEILRDIWSDITKRLAEIELRRKVEQHRGRPRIPKSSNS